MSANSAPLLRADVGEFAQLEVEFGGGENQCQLDRCWIGVICGLAPVDVINGVQVMVFASVVTKFFQRKVRYHLVGVHVGARSGAALNNIHAELLVVMTVLDVLARFADRCRLPGVEDAQFAVGLCCSVLDHRQGAHKVRVVGDWNPADGEVFQGPGGMCSPICCGRYGDISERIRLDAGGHGYSSSVEGGAVALLRVACSEYFEGRRVRPRPSSPISS